MTTTRSRYSSLTTIVTALFSLGFLLITPLAVASILGSVRGLIHDPQHRPEELLVHYRYRRLRRNGEAEICEQRGIDVEISETHRVHTHARSAARS